MQIIGHKKQLGYLDKILENKGQISHSFLFSGPEKIGKKTIALEFIKSIQCEKSDKVEKLCGICIGCQQINRVSADLLLVEPIKNENGGINEISIVAIRNLRNFMSARPSNNSFKIALIDDAHLMTREAQNALLKILEEPLGNKIIFLISYSPDNLLPTILSRAYLIKFNFAAEEDILKAIKSGEVNKIKKLIKIFNGRPGLVNEAVKNDKELDHIIDDFFKFAASNIEKRFKYIEKISKDKKLDVSLLLEKWIMMLRLALFQRAGMYDLIEGSGLENNLNDFSASRKVRNIADVLHLAQELYSLSKSTNINQRLALEILALKL